MQVSLGERKGAEIDYLKRFGNEWTKSGGNQDKSKSSPSKEFMSIHSRYQDLVNGNTLYRCMILLCCFIQFEKFVIKMIGVVLSIVRL